MPYQFKRLATGGLDAALAKAERYRDLNQPEEAESICRDVLDVEPAHPGALRTLGLALTDRFPRGGWATLFDEAVAVFGRLAAEYERVYYHGIAWERCAKAQVDAGEAHSAVASFEHALVLFGQAEKLVGPDVPDPVLRWNRCVRALTTHPALVAALRAPRGDVRGPQFGD